MYATNQFKKGLKIEIDGVPYEIVEFQHVSPGKGSAFTRTKLKNLIYQTKTEKTFKSVEKVAPADIEQFEMQFLYADNEGYHFMNMKSYDQIALSKEALGDSSGFLQENSIVQIMFYKGASIAVELPNFVELEVVLTEPSFKGDTVSGGGKPAKLKPGATVSVPYHIQEGDIIKVDTRDCSYVEKVNK